jgi:eukaryotic-like serine/threonine-protein kinase
VTVGCLEESIVLAFLGGRLPRDDRSGVESHVAICSACADLVTWTAADQASVTRLPGHEGRPFVGELHPGARIGRYQILGALGRGGMGEVYAAYHPDLDRRIAVKVVQGSGGSADERRGRLLREARAIARLSHPNVITVHDAGTFGDRVFIAMELVDGWTIEQWLRAEPRSWQQVLDVFVAAGRGLAAAHAAGVVHRDFKPQNVMIAKDGAVRVTDFGLARLQEEDGRDRPTAHDDESTVSLGPITKTGALVGTPAYMSPEQTRREAIDARSDQFSFCVALYEALFGKRPAIPGADATAIASGASSPLAPGSVPGWLRSIVARGAAVDREQRYRSMVVLIAALERGRTRVRRRLSVVAAAVALLVVSAGSWRIARGNRFVCAVPDEHLASAWSTNEADARRQSIHHAFAASGRATAETSWERVSKVFDQYVTAWRAMYMQTCEATHVRGEQSAEVLDLRMSCLNDHLDQVRALTAALATGTDNAVSHAVAAAQDLTPVSRCADVALLRSAVPLPRDEKTLREVKRLRRAVAELQALVDIGAFGELLRRSAAIRPAIEAIGYTPLLGEFLYLVGISETEIDSDATKGERTLRDALVVAEASRDDLTAATIATNLVYVVGYRQGHRTEAEFWARLGCAMLDRLGGDHSRLRAWADQGLGAALVRIGDFDGARVLLERSASLKEHSLGSEHPDFAISLTGLAYVLVRGGRPQNALAPATRAVEIIRKNGDPEASNLGRAYSNLGEVFNALGRYQEGQDAFENALKNLSKNLGAMHPEMAFALHGMGEVRLAQGSPASAARFFEEALRVRSQPQSDPTLAAESQFGLARALSERHSPKKARALAMEALTTYRREKRKEQRAVEAWLTDHHLN